VVGRLSLKFSKVGSDEIVRSSGPVGAKLREEVEMIKSRCSFTEKSESVGASVRRVGDRVREEGATSGKNL